MERAGYTPCSLHRVKRVAAKCMKGESKSQKEQMSKFWSLIKSGVTENRLAIEEPEENPNSAAQQMRLKELQMRVEANNKLIEEMVMAILGKVKNAKEIEKKVGADEITANEASMLEESVEMVREINDKLQFALEELRKVRAVKSMGDSVRRDSCSLIPRQSVQPMETE